MGSPTCRTSDWLSIGRQIVRNYEYEGALEGNDKIFLQISCTLGKGLFSVHKHVGFFIKPSLGYDECYLDARISASDKSQSTGVFPVKVMPANDGSTLIWLDDKRRTENLFDLLMSGKDMNLELLDEGRTIIDMPLPNDAGLYLRYHEMKRAKFV